MILVIDDERTFKNTPSGTIYKRSSDSALALLARMWANYVHGYNGHIDELWLDHDLGQDDDIIIVVKFLKLMAHSEDVVNLPIDQIFVHSQNPIGSETIISMLERYYKVKHVPLPELMEE